MTRRLAIALVLGAGAGLAALPSALAQQQQQPQQQQETQQGGGQGNQGEKWLDDPNRPGFIEQYRDFEERDKGVFADEDAQDEDAEDAEDRQGDQAQQGASGGAALAVDDLEEGSILVPKNAASKFNDSLSQLGYRTEGEVQEIGDLSDAISRFQQARGLEDTGELDVTTLHALGYDAIVVVHPDVEGASSVASQQGAAAERPAGLPQEASVIGSGENVAGLLILGSSQIESMQEHLKQQGFYQGEADGRISQDLFTAIESFKSAKGIQSRSMLDLATLALFPNLDVSVEETEKQVPGVTGSGMRGTAPSEMRTAPSDPMQSPGGRSQGSQGSSSQQGSSVQEQGGREGAIEHWTDEKPAGAEDGDTSEEQEADGPEYEQDE